VIERGYEGYVAKGRGQRVRGRADEAMAQDEAEGLDRRGGPLATADLRGGPAMMQLGRTASLVIVLLLASLGTASAECAWVLWMTDKGEGAPGIDVVDTFATKQECDARGVRLVGLYRATRPLMHYVCLPDTIDPRGPKGK
jgi:hypothetical protein